MTDAPVISTFVFADLAGYTALTEAHGDERAADVAAAFCDGLRALLDDYGAEEVKAGEETIVWRGVTYHFCSSTCAEAFRGASSRYVRPEGSRALTLVSDDAREKAARQLARAYLKGRIGGEELERRTEGVWSAQTRADLDDVTHDLPRRRSRRVPAWQLPIFPLMLLVRIARARVRRLRGRR